MTNEKGTEHQLLTESVIFYRKCFSYSSHIMIIQKTTPNQTDIRNAPTPYLLPIYSFLLYKEKEAFGPANIRNR